MVAQRCNQVAVQRLDVRRTFHAVRGRAIGRNVKGLVGVARVVEVVGGVQQVFRGDVVVDATEERSVVHDMIHRLAVILVEAGLVKVQQHLPLAVAICVDLGVADVAAKRRVRHRARAREQGRCVVPAQVRPQQALVNALARAEVEEFVALDRSADASAELLAMEVRERLAIRCVRGQSLKALVLEQAAMKGIGPGLGDDVDHTAAGASELGVRAARDDLELLDRFERDVDRRALTAGLLAEEAVVVVAPVERDVVEDPALPVDVDLIAVGPLRDADTRRERQQVFKLAAQHGCRRDSLLAKRGRSGRGAHVDQRGRGDHHRLRRARHLQCQPQRRCQTDGQVQVLLNRRRKARLRDRDFVAARLQGRKLEVSRPVGEGVMSDCGIHLIGFDVGIRNDRARGVADLALNPSVRGLYLGARRNAGCRQNEPKQCTGGSWWDRHTAPQKCRR